MLGFGVAYQKSREKGAWDVLKATRCGRRCTLEIKGYGSGGLKPTPVPASLAVVFFARNKGFSPHYAVNGKPVSPAVARALQKTGLLLYFWIRSQQEIPFLIVKSANEVGVSLYSKKVSLGRRVRFPPPTAKLISPSLLVTLIPFLPLSPPPSHTLSPPPSLSFSPLSPHLSLPPSPSLPVPPSLLSPSLPLPLLSFSLHSWTQTQNGHDMSQQKKRFAWNRYPG